jgi:hypothetical protein
LKTSPYFPGLSGAGKDPWLSTIGTLATTLTQIAVVGITIYAYRGTHSWGPANVAMASAISPL